MSPRRHLDDLFSAAYEDELSPIEEARFRTHMQSCAPCAAAYAEFRATIEALHELPRARMPHVVHLPSTPPVAELVSRPRIGLSWFNLGLVRRFPATAIAGAAAVVLVVVALTHNGVSPENGTAGRSALSVPAAAPAHGSTAACTTIADITAAALPSSFTQEALATDPAQPALHLVLAAPTLVVIPGQQAVVYAQLSVPGTAISGPGAAATPPSARALLPCVSIGVGNTGQGLAASAAGIASLDVPRAPGAATPSAGLGYQIGKGVGPLLTFQVPAGLAHGTEIHVTATIPAGYTGPGSPPLTAELTLTTR
ncbi:MAG TPA: zf-HC2 domain-containing protein [Thermoanaerobaculia bacterium]|nr:zf-HC2 domain-containing protein [Thermoanaerobaculia bacterium]